jgi:hypothetical protein
MADDVEGLVDGRPVHEHEVLRRASPANVESAPSVPKSRDAREASQVSGEIASGARRRDRLDVGRADTAQTHFGLLHRLLSLYRHLFEFLGRSREGHGQGPFRAGREVNCVLSRLMTHVTDLKVISPRSHIRNLVESVSIRGSRILKSTGCVA